MGLNELSSKTLALPPRRTYLIVLGAEETDFDPDFKSFASKQGFVPIAANDAGRAIEIQQTVEHCLGFLAYSSQGERLSHELSQRSEFNRLQTRSIQAWSEAIPTLKRFVIDLYPEKLRELSLFAHSKIFSALLPSLTSPWRVVDPFEVPTSADFLVSCETMAERFLGSVSIQGRIESVRSIGTSFQVLQDDDVAGFFAEVGNEILGMMNHNFLKMGVHGNITLPMVLRDPGVAQLRRKQSYFMPSLTLLNDPSSLRIRFQFLVPFMRAALFDTSMNFEVGAEGYGDVEFF